VTKAGIVTISYQAWKVLGIVKAE